MLYRIVPKGTEISGIFEKNNDLWGQYELRDIVSGSYEDKIDFNLKIIYSEALNDLGFLYFNNKLFPQAISLWQRSLAIHDNATVQANILTAEQFDTNPGK